MASTASLLAYSFQSAWFSFSSVVSLSVVAGSLSTSACIRRAVRSAMVLYFSAIHWVCSAIRAERWSLRVSRFWTVVKISSQRVTKSALGVLAVVCQSCNRCCRLVVSSDTSQLSRMTWRQLTGRLTATDSVIQAVAIGFW